LLAGILGRLLGLGRTGARRGALVAVGGRASVVRAVILAGLALFAGSVGRYTSTAGSS